MEDSNINLTVVKGSLKNIITFEIDGLEGYSFSRDDYNKIGELEIQRAIYLLVGRDDKFKVYVGQTKNILKRIGEHIKKKDWWTHVIFVYDEDFSSDYRNWLERDMYDHFKLLSKTVKLMNDQIPVGEKKMKRWRKISIIKKSNKFKLMVDLLLHNNIISKKPLLKKITPIKKVEIIPTFKPILVKSPTPVEKYIESKIIKNNNNFVCKRRGIRAYMAIDGKAFVVLKNSTILPDNDKYRKHLVGAYKTRKILIDSNDLKKTKSGYLLLLHNIAFETASGAAEFVIGTTANGGVEWKRERDNKRLKDII